MGFEQDLMTKFHATLLACLIVVTSACAHKAESVDASEDNKAPASAPSGQVNLPADSPKLRQIRVEPIQSVEIPTDEVTAPGSLEVDPGRVSHVMLPVPGRVTAVMANLGDAVEKG